MTSPESPTSTTPSPHPRLDAVPAYKQGRSAPAGASKLSSNESPHPPLPSVVAAIADRLGSIHRYPQMTAPEIIGRLAERYGVAPDLVTVGAGSVELAAQIIHATAGEGDEVMFAWRSFEAYPSLVRVAGATPVMVPLDREHRHDLDAMLAAITDRTRLIFVCNPNNPTSTVVPPADLARFVESVPSDILVVIDEAYVEYIRDGLLPDSLGLVRDHANVVVLRTFSKAYGLAGARVGYAVGDPDIITALGKVYVPFTASTLAQAAAIASVQAADELLARTDAVVAERVRVSAALRGAGYVLPDSQANFVWLPLGPDHTADFVEQAANARVLVRPYGTDGVRVTIGAPHENDTLLAFATDWIARTGQR